MLIRPLFAFALGLLGSGTASAGLLLTEIYYNGPTGGSDPDEFLELSNGGEAAIALEGYAFTAGIDYTFGAGSQIGAGESLLLVANPAGFAGVFPEYSGALFDFAGALSNGGELLQFNSADGSVLWSFSYDDGGAWPGAADGGGESLQLLPGAADYADPASWEGALPTPGTWRGLDSGPPTASVATPGTLALLAALLPWLTLRRRRSSP
jgi:hypothetical protein